MKTVKFTNRENGFYSCSESGDQSGEYVRADIAEKLLAACKAFVEAYKRDAFDCNKDGEDVRVLIQDAIVAAEN